MDYYSTIKNENEILPFITAWMDPESIVLSEKSQNNTNTVGSCLYVQPKKQNRKQRLPWQSSGEDSMLPLQGSSVQSLVRELRFHMLWGMEKEKNEPRTSEQRQTYRYRNNEWLPKGWGVGSWVE